MGLKQQGFLWTSKFSQWKPQTVIITAQSLFGSSTKDMMILKAMVPMLSECSHNIDHYLLWIAESICNLFVHTYIKNVFYGAGNMAQSIRPCLTNRRIWVHSPKIHLNKDCRGNSTHSLVGGYRKRLVGLWASWPAYWESSRLVRHISENKVELIQRLCRSKHLVPSLVACVSNPQDLL